ncbi:MAG: DUF349 domain-containing protein, partial [Acidobacteria bacterium]|nr:DUF349 domain-containing protein [Acidobacteriota bacterium]
TAPEATAEPADEPTGTAPDTTAESDDVAEGETPAAAEETAAAEAPDPTAEAASEPEAAATAASETQGETPAEGEPAAETKTEAPGERRERHLADTCRRAEELAGVEAYKGFERKWRKIQERWQELTQDEPAPEALEERFKTASAAVEQRREQEADRQAQRRTDNLARLKGLTERMEALGGTEELSLRKAHRTNREAQLALRNPGPLPAGDEAASQWADLKQRLQAAYDALAPRVAQLEQEEEWKRWANVPLQEELCERMEALATDEDLGHAAGELRRLSEEWKKVASAPPEKSEELWQRFRTAREAVRERTKDFFDEQKKQRQDNLDKKRELAEKVEALAESTDWKQTAEEIKQLQAEWKAVGPVPRKHSDTIWKRFRTACDQFFDRRKTFYDSLHQERMDNFDKKRALVEQVEALAESTDWDQTTEKIKRLQAQWKSVGPVPRKHSELVWKRFRKACDTFFDRRSRRHEVGLEDNLKKREELIGELEALLPKAPAKAEATKPAEPTSEAAPAVETPAEETTDEGAPTEPATEGEAAAEATTDEAAPSEAGAEAEEPAAEPAEVEEVAEASAVYEAEPAMPADLAGSVQRIRDAWRQAGDVPTRHVPTLEKRWSEVSDRLVEAYGEHLAGTDLDPMANQRKREQLVQRYEELVTEWRKQRDEKPQEPSLQDLAAQLKAALAANTIRGAGGRAADDAWQQVRQKAGRIEESWSRIPGKPDPEVAARFEKARKELAHLQPSAAS